VSPSNRRKCRQGKVKLSWQYGRSAEFQRFPVVPLCKCSFTTEVSCSQVQPPLSSPSSQLSSAFVCHQMNCSCYHQTHPAPSTALGRCVAFSSPLFMQSGLAGQSSRGAHFPTRPCHASTGVQPTEQRRSLLDLEECRGRSSQRRRLQPVYSPWQDVPSKKDPGQAMEKLLRPGCPFSLFCSAFGPKRLVHVPKLDFGPSH